MTNPMCPIRPMVVSKSFEVVRFDVTIFWNCRRPSDEFVVRERDDKCPEVEEPT